MTSYMVKRRRSMKTTKLQRRYDLACLLGLVKIVILTQFLTLNSKVQN